ncbi:MAG TPA: zinc-ribbon domain-containing protein, partial [Actinomycetota bacterium]
MQTCATCGTENVEGARFCSNCGSPLGRTCPNCGEAVAEEARFCSNCGHALEPVEAPVEERK